MLSNEEVGSLIKNANKEGVADKARAVAQAAGRKWIASGVDGGEDFNSLTIDDVSVIVIKVPEEKENMD